MDLHDHPMTLRKAVLKGARWVVNQTSSIQRIQWAVDWDFLLRYSNPLDYPYLRRTSAHSERLAEEGTRVLSSYKHRV
jgi:hypothetical protein